MDPLISWLRSLRLERYAKVFADNEVDFETIQVLTEKDLEELGIPFGPRKKLVNALSRHHPEAHEAQTRPSALETNTDFAANHTQTKLQVEGLASKASHQGERRQLTVRQAAAVEPSPESYRRPLP